MTELSKWIQEFLDAKNWQQQELAIEWHQGASEGKLSTFETRLSKIMGDEEEGYKYALKTPPRLAALAAALGVSEEMLRSRLEAELDRTTLIIGPDVDSQAVAFVQELAQASEGRVCVLNLAAASREDVRDAALKSRSPLIVIGPTSPRDFFEGAMLKVSVVTIHRGRYQLEGRPDLTVLAAARLRDEDGMPMVPLLKLESKLRQHAEAERRSQQNQYGRAHDTRLSREETLALSSMNAADAAGREASFRLNVICHKPNAQMLRNYVILAVFARAAEQNRGVCPG